MHYTQQLNFIIIFISDKLFSTFFYHIKAYQISIFFSIHIMHIICINWIPRIRKCTFLTLVVSSKCKIVLLVFYPILNNKIEFFFFLCCDSFFDILSVIFLWHIPVLTSFKVSFMSFSSLNSSLYSSFFLQHLFVIFIILFCQFFTTFIIVTIFCLFL